MYSDVRTCSASNCIGNADATSIPDEVIDCSVLFYDTGIPYFDYIPTKTYTQISGYATFDFRYLIKNDFDNSLVWYKLELSDKVNFQVVGTYYVQVAVEDEEGNRFSRWFQVKIVPC